jgi:hypothetical protein
MQLQVHANEPWLRILRMDRRADQISVSFPEKWLLSAVVLRYSELRRVVVVCLHSEAAPGFARVLTSEPLVNATILRGVPGPTRSLNAAERIAMVGEPALGSAPMNRGAQ